ncbi:hypothetical protein B5M09_013202 [Aphanomyces astaci]|uniref:DDE Tnp4 domain-containing protein n=1 Tax=Aphanomyces astaci TaxID=112090 RepID=A0A425DNT3_APHAT|nr:hypothetical protein B5M09_013202 [Aphanomyces astaci]
MSVLDESRAVSARDLLLMLFTSLKHCGTWDVVAAVFKQKPTTFEKRVMSFLITPAVAGHWFKNFARYATDVTFQQTNVPSGAHAEKKIYYSGKHSLYGHRVEVSVVPNGFTIDCTKFYKISVSDKTIFDENIDSHLANLAKRTGETTLEDSELGLEQWAVLADKGYQGIQHNVRTVLPLKKPAGGNSPLRSKRRMTVLPAIASDTYRWSRKSYDIVFQACLALINVHVRLHPLCAEDGDANAQYIFVSTQSCRNKISPQEKPRRRYTQAIKRAMLSVLQSASTRDVEAATEIPKSNLARWANQTTKLFTFDGTATSMALSTRRDPRHSRSRSLHAQAP